VKEGSYLFEHASAWERQENEGEGTLLLGKVSYIDDDIFVTSKRIL
jgi:hypothetical protein